MQTVESLAEMEREVPLALSLCHRNVAQTFARVTDDGGQLAGMAMEYLMGDDLHIALKFASSLS